MPNDHSRSCERIPTPKNQSALTLVPSLCGGTAPNDHSCGRPAQRILPPHCVKESPKPKKSKPLVQPLPRRHAWLAGPPANTCSRNRPQNKRQQRPPTKPKTPRAVTLWRHACLTTPVVNTCSRNGPSPTAKESPPPSSFRNLRRKAGLPSHRNPEGILSHPLLWSPRAADSTPPICGGWVGRWKLKKRRHSGHHFAQAEGKCPESPPPGGASHRSCGCAVAKRLHGRGGAGEAPGEFFHILSRGQHSPPTPEQSSKKQHRHSGIFRRGEAVTGNIRNLPRQRAATPPAPATALP